MYQAGRGEVTYDWNGIFHPMSEHWLWFMVFFIEHLYPVIQVTPHPHLCLLNPPSMAWSPPEGPETPTPLDIWLVPRLAVVYIWHPSPASVLPVTVLDMSGIRRKHGSAGLEDYLSKNTVKMAFPQFGFHKTLN